MSDTEGWELTREPPRPAVPPQIVIQNLPPKQPWMGRFLTRALLALSIFGNIALFGLYQRYYPNVTANERFQSGEKFANSKIAIIKVHDIITTSTIAAPKRELETAQKDKDVKAVVIDIDSPGGTIAGSDELYHAIEEFRRISGKPVVASMRQLAASGGYYIACPADKIVAERSCITGSIGVIAQLFNAQELLSKVGVQPEIIKSGKMKDSGAFWRPMTPEERADWQETIDAMYQQFLGIILKHRSEQIGGEEKLRKLADGRTFLAEEAKRLGLIDEVGYQDDAVRTAKDLAKIAGDYRVVTYSRPSGIFSMLDVEAPRRQLDLGKLAKLASPGLYYLPPGMAALAGLVD